LYPSIDSGENFANCVDYDVLAFREIRGFTRHHLTIIDKIYEFDIPPIILDYLAISGCTARAFFKLMKVVKWRLTEESFSALIYEDRVKAAEFSVLIKFDGQDYFDRFDKKDKQDKIRKITSDFISCWCRK
jgi:hypothetical protein